uniref:Piwi domain-containing protein n=1 Tax=Aegilops tauschii subsp. strangulata TaxID=200361 RepID=A0A453SZ10_AEGTS
MNRWSMKMEKSANLPCLIAGKAKHPTYLPLEVCVLLPLQRYKKSLSTLQRSKLVEGSRQRPDQRMLSLSGLNSADGRELHTPNGRWNFNNDIPNSALQRFIQPIKVKMWGVVNFSARCNVEDLVRRLIQSGPWKRECLVEHGIFTQCLVPPPNIKDQYLTNVLLKINAKLLFCFVFANQLGGLNSLLKKETTRAIPHVSRVPTIIFGMDVSHGSPGRNVPSVAAVVSSLKWPIMSKYRASVCTQSPRLEMIDTLFKPVGDDDHGLIKDGVSESQFNQALNEELAQIMEACKFFGGKHFNGNWFPKFTLIVAQMNHHTRFFLQNGQRPDQVNNVPPVLWLIEASAIPVTMISTCVLTLA